MIGWLMRRSISAFERTWNYNAAYMRDVLDADPAALWTFSKVMGLSKYRKDVPTAAYYAAKIAGVMAEDCGACTQLNIDMAQKAGVDAASLRAMVTRDFAAMPPDAALAFRFAEATLQHAAEANSLREEIERRWGKRGLVSLAFAITSARIFPTLKYALGHGQACARLAIGGEPCTVAREASQPA